MKKTKVLSVILCLTALMNFTLADNIRGINMDFVNIGNAGNAGDTRDYYANPIGCGAVSYNYRIGKYEVTNAQFNAFTATAGVPTGNPSSAYDQSASFTGAQQPANNVSWYEAAQFCNYLTSGDKSKGAYQFSGSNAAPGNFLGIDRVSSISTYGTTYVIPTEDEWYKAAYFKPDASGYSLFANGTSTAPINGVNSNYDSGAPWDITNGTQEQNGTFNMMGNVWEWNEALPHGSSRGIRGDSYYYLDEYYLRSYDRDYVNPDGEYPNIGFRVAEIPEPASATIMTLGGLLFALKRRKR